MEDDLWRELPIWMRVLLRFCGVVAVSLLFILSLLIFMVIFSHIPDTLCVTLGAIYLIVGALRILWTVGTWTLNYINWLRNS